MRNQTPNLGLWSVTRAFERRGIFIVPLLLWHGAPVFAVSSEWPPLILLPKIRGYWELILTRIPMVKNYPLHKKTWLIAFFFPLRVGKTIISVTFNMIFRRPQISRQFKILSYKVNRYKCYLIKSRKQSCLFCQKPNFILSSQDKISSIVEYEYRLTILSYRGSYYNKM